MAFGFAGAGAGAAKSLEEILGQQMQQAMLQQREQQAQAEMELKRQQLAESARQADVDSGQRQQQIDMQAGDRRQRTNVQGIRRMLGESITQRQGPITSDDRRGMAALQVEAGDDPTLLNEPKVERDPIADHEAKARIDAKYREPKAAPSGPKTPLWVRQPDGSVIDANGVAPPGSKPYDPVAERSSKPLDNGEAADTAREAGRLADALLAHKGFGGAFGVVDSMLPTLRQDTADAEALRDSLTSLLTLENMGKMKGVLSDSDMKVLRQASTTLSGKMSNKAARAELTRLSLVMKRAAGDAPAQTAGGAGGNAADPVDAMIAKYGKKKP